MPTVEADGASIIVVLLVLLLFGELVGAVKLFTDFTITDVLEMEVLLTAQPSGARSNMTPNSAKQRYMMLLLGRKLANLLNEIFDKVYKVLPKKGILWMEDYFNPTFISIDIK